MPPLPSNPELKSMAPSKPPKANLPPTKSRGLRPMQVVWIVVAAIVLSVAITFWFVRSYIYAADFEPVELSQAEQHKLQQKLEVLGYQPEQPTRAFANQQSDAEWLRPERYAENQSSRQVEFSERELNAMIANNRDLAKKLAVDLSDDLVSARLLVPLQPDFPILGGKTLRVSAGVEAAFSQGQPKVILRGVSLMGVPIPGAWLGGLKNIDLVDEFGNAGGFWQDFAQGVDDIQVHDGKLLVRLKP